MKRQTAAGGEANSGSLTRVALGVLLVVICMGLVWDGQRIATTAAIGRPSSEQEDELALLALFDGRDRDLPIVFVTSSVEMHSLEYFFAPSAVSLMVHFPEAWVEEAGRRPVADDLQMLLDAVERIGATYNGDPLIALGALEGKPGYVVTHRLVPDANALLDNLAELKLVHRSPDGTGRWYRTRQ